MQIILQLQPDRPLCVPFNYQYQLQSAIYKKLAEIDASDFWHDVGFGDARKFKAFSFGSLKGKYTVSENKIRFENSVSLEVRSPVFAFCDDLQRALELNPQLKLFDTYLTVANASIVNRHINHSSAVFKTESPVLVYRNTEQGKTRYFTPEEEEFYIGICNNFERKYEAIFNIPSEHIQIRPTGSSFKKVVTRYKSTWLTGYHGVFEVKGTPKSLELLYNTGMGAKNPEGFGFIRVLHNDKPHSIQ